MKNPGKNLPAIPFTTVTADEAMIDKFRSEGHTSFPVVIVDRGPDTYAFSGYRHDEITRLAELFQ